MKRFILSEHAAQDLDEIIAYVQALPERPGRKLGKLLQETLYDLADHPRHGHIHEGYTELAGVEIRRFVSSSYVFFYEPKQNLILFAAILHGNRDVDSIMRERMG